MKLECKDHDQRKGSRIYADQTKDCKNLHNHYKHLHLLLVPPVELEQEPVHNDPHGADVAVVLLPVRGGLGLAGVCLQLPRLVLDLDGIVTRE